MKTAPRIFIFAAALGLTASVPPAQAQVTGTVENAWVDPGATVTVGLTLDSLTAVHGINGELSFDPAVLSNPQVTLGAGAPGYIVRGNETAPGTFRFILYDPDPEAAMSTLLPVIEFSFSANPDITSDTPTVLTFSMEAAANIPDLGQTDVISIGQGGPGGAPPPQTVTFNGFSIIVVKENRARDWSLYD